MKNLVTCTPDEFVAQTYKIATVINKWFDGVDFTGIKRRNLPKPIAELGKDATPEEKQKAVFEYNEDVKACARNILTETILSMMGENADKTVEILALTCFVDPSEANEHSMSEYMKELSQMLYDPVVADFFTSVRQSGVLSLLRPSRQ